MQAGRMIFVFSFRIVVDIIEVITAPLSLQACKEDLTGLPVNQLSPLCEIERLVRCKVTLHSTASF
jgi:hypothetical protein